MRMDISLDLFIIISFKTTQITVLKIREADMCNGA